MIIAEDMYTKRDTKQLTNPTHLRSVISGFFALNDNADINILKLKCEGISSFTRNKCRLGR